MKPEATQTPTPTMNVRALQLIFVSFVAASACARPVPPAPARAHAPVAAPPPPAPAPPPAPVPAPPVERVSECAEPSRLVLIGSIPVEPYFVGDTLATEQASYDPDTLRAGAPVAFPANAENHDDFYNALHPQGRYCDSAGGVGIVANEEGNCMMSAGLVERIDTGKLVARFDANGFGGTSPYYSSRLSRTGRFVMLQTSRSGTALFDLKHKKRHKQAKLVLRGGFGLRLSPNDRYLVVVPSPGFIPETIERTDWEWYELGRHAKSRELAKLASESEVVPGFDAAFCGDGNLFAVSLAARIVVLRGKDATELVAIDAPTGGGLTFSASGRYLTQAVREQAGVRTLVYRLE